MPLQWANNNCSSTALPRPRDYPFTSLLALEHIQLVLLLTLSCNFFSVQLNEFNVFTV